MSKLVFILIKWMRMMEHIHFPLCILVYSLNFWVPNWISVYNDTYFPLIHQDLNLTVLVRRGVYLATYNYSFLIWDCKKNSLKCLTFSWGIMLSESLLTEFKWMVHHKPHTYVILRPPSCMMVAKSNAIFDLTKSNALQHSYCFKACTK